MADCKTCKRSPDGNQYAADIVAANAETANLRMFIIWIITFLLLVGTNAFWIWRDSQFATETWTYEATTDDGGNAIANGDGEVNIYGSSESDAHEANP